MTLPNQDDLTTALSNAGTAHHDFEQVVLSGTRDELWAGFYAAYVLGRLGDFVAPSTLSKWLGEAPGSDQWPKSAAGYVLKQLA